jgi:hypothetical protein
MTQDKQLSGIKLKVVLQKQQLGQALNVKEFAVLAGICYSTAREWFRIKGFPAFNGKVFWQDFFMWRQRQTGVSACVTDATEKVQPSPKTSNLNFPERARNLLSQA